MFYMIKTNITQKEEKLLRREMWRKSIHIFSLLIPIIYIFVTREFALSVLVPMAAAAIFVDLLYRNHRGTRKFFLRIFGSILRPHEVKKRFALNGATCVLISAVVLVFAVPKIVMVTAFSILIISDLSAALVGRRFGKTDFLNKSLEGSLAFALTAMATVVAYGLLFNAPWTYFAVGLISAVIGAIVEGASENFIVDDNFSIPFSIAVLMWLGGAGAAAIGFPYLNLI